jgi:hypothetical protein
MSKKISFRALFIICALVLSSSSLHAQKATWQKYTHDASNASILFPDEFEESVDEKTNEDDEIYLTTKANVTYDGVVYFLGITMHASDFVYSSDLEQASIDAFVEGVGGTETSRKVWKQKGHDGVEVRIETANALMLYRVLIVDSKQIQVVIALPMDGEEHSKINKKFFKSFKMK